MRPVQSNESNAPAEASPQSSAVAATAVFEGAEIEGYSPSPLHAADRIWSETNCYVDLWIEVINALGSDPRAMLGFTLRQDFEGDQFTFFKPELKDLDELYGIRVTELALFDDVETHVSTQVARQRMCLVEVDPYFLPDTQGTDYRTAHGKTSVGVNRIDPNARHLEYFHNGGYYELSDEDYDGVFQRNASTDSLPYLPYVEFASFPIEVPSEDALRDTALAHFETHLQRRPAHNPIRAYASVFPAQVRAVAERDFEFFHKYAFNTTRQLGANFELAADHLRWLGAEFEAAAEHALQISNEAKSLQFRLARAVRRKKFDGLDTALEPAAQAWDELVSKLVELRG